MYVDQKYEILIKYMYPIASFFIYWYFENWLPTLYTIFKGTWCLTSNCEFII